MNARNVTMIAAVLSFGLFTLTESALAQEQSAAAQSDCKHVKAQSVEVSTDPATASGIVTNGGRLNGTTLTVFGNGALPTPDPTTVSFTGDFTLTTNHGQLKASNVYLYNFAGVGATLGASIRPPVQAGSRERRVYCIPPLRSPVSVHSPSNRRLRAKSVSQNKSALQTVVRTFRSAATGRPEGLHYI
jgi:hypothetical protein